MLSINEIHTHTHTHTQRYECKGQEEGMLISQGAARREKSQARYFNRENLMQGTGFKNIRRVKTVKRR